ncbi:hypothetical protein LCGC14_0292280 [marine sediment metagenome]|uniref:Uncharacterized protein n=1 Tax=marine sediment metagenome TaxID=412755 RepID=A0A0F9TSX4_9ZZZZ|nr:hypothetical protein [Maribacter sp.]HDZ06226.1 hypothetical protein [Maribacter sp.]
MKTYNFVACLMLAFSFVACEKSTDTSTEEIKTSIVSDYTVFMQNNNQLNAVVVNSTGEDISVESALISFNNIPSNSLKYRTPLDISYFYITNCQSHFQWYDASSATTKSIQLFNDLNSCVINVMATAHSIESAFIAYERELLGKDKQFVVRVNSLAQTTNNYTEIILDKKPVDIIASSDRLFVLTLDEFVTNTYYLSVIDLDTDVIIMELDLGIDALRLFTNNSGKVIVSYPELHTTIDPVSLDKEYTTYGENTEPGFITTKDFYMDGTGKFYFHKNMPSATVSEVPAIYDFEKNSTVVYLFENFLTETELNVKYNIAETTAIAYDDKNNYVLIGYKENGTTDKGGILRITPSPDFKLIDNLNLEGVPQTIFVK